MSLLAKCVVFGIPGTVAYTGVAATEQKTKSVSLVDKVRVGDARDGQGRIFASNVERDDQTLTVDIIPFDSDGTTLAHAQAAIFLPAPGAVVTLASFGNPLIDGSWNYVGGASIEYTEGDAHVIIRGIQLRRVAADGVTAAAQTVLV